MNLVISRPHDDKFYLGRPYAGEPLPDLSAARAKAAWLQANGKAMSMPIYRNGECVDFKRY